MIICDGDLRVWKQNKFNCLLDFVSYEMLAEIRVYIRVDKCVLCKINEYLHVSAVK